MAIKTRAEEAIAATQESVTATVSQAAVGIDQTVAQLKDSLSQASAEFETTQVRFKEGVQKMMKTTEEIVAFNQGNVEALVKSGQVWVAGVQDLSRQVAATAQASIEQGMANFKAMTAVKSLKEAIDLQSSMARTAIEKTLAESSKLTDASLKLTEQTMAPIAARFSLAIQKFSAEV